jgi:hypothetical protein
MYWNVGNGKLKQQTERTKKKRGPAPQVFMNRGLMVGYTALFNPLGGAGTADGQSGRRGNRAPCDTATHRHFHLRKLNLGLV